MSDTYEEKITRIKTVKECENFAKNATKRGREDLAKLAIQRSLEIRANGKSPANQAEKEALQAVYAYEETLRKKNGRNTRASRTWDMIDRHGIIEAVERVVSRTTVTQGYTALIEMGLEHHAFEAVVLRHPEYFSKTAVQTSKIRAEEWADA